MKCPNCESKVKMSELIGRSTNPDASWYQITDTELHCPKCDSKITYTRRPQVIAGTGAVIYACIHLSNLLYQDNSYKVEINVIGLIIFTASLIYWHRKKDLILVK